MMYNTRYLPENFEQCRLEKTILRHFLYNLNLRSSWNALIQDGGKTMKSLFCTNFEAFTAFREIFTLIRRTNKASSIKLTIFP